MNARLTAEDKMWARATGALLRKRREQKGLTACAVADRAGVHVNTIYRIEDGDGACSTIVLFRVALILGIGTINLVPNLPLKRD